MLVYYLTDCAVYRRFINSSKHYFVSPATFEPVFFALDLAKAVNLSTIFVSNLLADITRFKLSI